MTKKQYADIYEPTVVAVPDKNAGTKLPSCVTAE